MMTGKERLTRACKGLEVDRVPWTPMLFQWFQVKACNGTLPEALKGCKSAMDASRVMQADLFGKHEAFVTYASYSRCSFSCRFSGKSLRGPVVSCLMDVFGPKGNVFFDGKAERHDCIVTPKGELTSSWIYDEQAGAPYEGKHYWQEFEAEYEAVRALLQDIEFICDQRRWNNVLREIGEDGIAHLRIPPTPLKILHWLAGPEQATYYLMDYPDKVMELVKIYEAKRLNLVRKIAALKGTLVFTSGDNMDSMMYSPPIFEDYCGRSFKQIAEVLHDNGKLLFTHSCGQLAKVIKLCADSGVDGMEGMAPPPLGDLDFGTARDMLGSKFVLQGGMTYMEEEMAEPNTREKIFQRVEQLFSSLPDKRAFIFSSGCCPGPKAKYGNLIALRDSSWQYGQLS